MIETLVSVRLPADEVLSVKKNRLTGVGCEGGKRIAVVTGIHGDELEGQYVCYELVRLITANMAHLKGTVDIYPSINPLGMESVSRAVPMSGLDMNRVFPGSTSGAVARIPSAESSALLKYAKMLNTDFVWVHDSNAVGEGSLAAALREVGVPTLVIEMGVGQRITKAYCKQLLSGIFNLMSKLGIWVGPTENVSHPMVSTDGAVHVIHSVESGIFIPKVEHNMWVQKGTLIGEIVTPITGTVEEEIIAPSDGLIFSLREYPIVYEGSVIARILSMS